MARVRQGDRLGWYVAPITIGRPSLFLTLLQPTVNQNAWFDSTAEAQRSRDALERKLRDWNFLYPYVAVNRPSSTSNGSLAVQVTAPWDYSDEREIFQNIAMNARQCGFTFSDANIETAHNGSGHPAGQGQVTGGSTWPSFAAQMAVEVPGVASQAIVGGIGAAIDNAVQESIGWGPLILGAAVLLGMVFVLRD